MAANILVIDDSLVYVRMLQQLLEKEKHNIFTSTDGLDVFDILNLNKIDVILLDIILPQIDGFDILKELQKQENTRDIPVIMVTGITNPKEVKKALDLGALDYIKKPSEPMEVIARVCSALRLKAKQDLLKEYAIKDPLTKAYNRGFINKSLKNLIAETPKLENGLSLLMLDCDFFKAVNDSYGHVAGDIVLSSVSDAMKKSVRELDIVGRYGGEEFCAILPNTSKEMAVMAADRIRVSIQNLGFKFNEIEFNITVSLGVAHISLPNVSVIELFNRADAALYRAKSGGRNRVEVFEY